MIESPGSGGAAVEQARMELSMAASSAERANRPRYLVWLGALCVAVAAIALLMALSTRTKEFLRLSKARNAAHAVEQQKQEWDALAAQLRARGMEPDPRMVSKLELIGMGEGLDLAGKITDTEELGNLPAGMTRRTYTVRGIQGENPQGVLGWIASTQDPRIISNLEITQLRFGPATATGASGKTGGMNFEVVFGRFERKEPRR